MAALFLVVCYGCVSIFVFAVVALLDTENVLFTTQMDPTSVFLNKLTSYLWLFSYAEEWKVNLLMFEESLMHFHCFPSRHCDGFKMRSWNGSTSFRFPILSVVLLAFLYFRFMRVEMDVLYIKYLFHDVSLSKVYSTSFHEINKTECEIVVFIILRQ